MTPSDKFPPLFYCTVHGVTSGPYSVTQLRTLLEDGHVLQTDPAWRGGSVKPTTVEVILREFGNLPRSIPRQTPHRVEPQSQAGSKPVPNRALSGEFDLPLIRIRFIRGILERGLLGLFHGYEITACFSDSIVTARTVSRPDLNDVQCTPEGLTAFLNECSFRKVIFLHQIGGAEFVGYVQRTFGSRLRLEPLADLRLGTPFGNRRIRMLRRDLPNVHRFLQVALGKRMSPSVRWRRRHPGLLKCFLLIGPICGSLRLLFRLIGFAGSPLLSAVLTILGVSLFTKLFTFDCRPQLPFDCLTAVGWPPLQGFRRSQAPWRSPTAGILLRGTGLVLVCLILYAVPMAITEWSQVRPLDDMERGRFTRSMVSSLLLVPMILLYVGNALSQAAAARTFGADHRRPILYLRSFALDGRTTLQPDTSLSMILGVSGTGSLSAFYSEVSNWLSNVFSLRNIQLVHPIRLFRLGLGVLADSTEQSLVKYFSNVGPVFAIGNPGERIVECGANREYVDDDKWQSLVVKYLSVAQAIILQPGGSAGMSWELEMVFRNYPREKVLIVIANSAGHANDYEDLRRQLRPLLSGRALPKCAPYRRHPSMIWFEHDGTIRATDVSYRSPASWLFRGDAVDLEYTLRPFVQGLHGGDREQPRPLRKFGWHHSATAWLLALLWMVIYSALLTYQWAARGPDL